MRSFIVICLVAVMACCHGGPQPALMRLTEARRLAAELRVKFNQAADASNRSVMADTDEASIAFAREAEQAEQVIKRDSEALSPLLAGLGYEEEGRSLAEFDRHFAEYQAMDTKVLALAVENTNLKAQRLSFGPAREAADAVRDSLDSIARAASPKNRCRIESLTASAVLAVREVQVLHAPHIAEADDAAMTHMEQQMSGLLATARQALSTLAPLVEPGSRAQLTSATAALDRFNGTHTQIIALSRRNTNVRSLALSLGQMRSLTAACDASLGALQDALAAEGFRATR